MTLRRGWCPGALRPMETGDGLLVRVRPRAGRYTLPQLTVIATASRLGNGEIDLTNRANLQLRGLSGETLPLALDLLDAAGLLDESPAIERVRNVIVSPLAEEAAFDLAHQLETALAHASHLAALPGKFGFAIDTVAAPLPARARGDIRLTLDGARVQVLPAWSASAACEAEIHDAVSAALALAGSYLSDRSPSTGGRCEPASRPAGSPASLIFSSGAPIAFGIGLPFGRIRSDALESLAEAAAHAGVTHVHPCVQRCLVFPLNGHPHTPLADAACSNGLITDPTDPRLAMDVCPGSPACARATTDTRADAGAIARQLARMTDHPASIHISGCVKGCARSSASALTLVARDGAYDLIRNGRAGDTPVLSGIAPDALATHDLNLFREPRA